MYSLTCVAVSYDGKYIAVGCSNGYVLILDYSTRQVMKMIKDRSSKITCLRYSPDKKWLSVGGTDAIVINYYDTSNLSPRSKIYSHNTPISHLDFDSKSRYI